MSDDGTVEVDGPTTGGRKDNWDPVQVDVPADSPEAREAQQENVDEGVGYNPPNN